MIALHFDVVKIHQKRTGKRFFVPTLNNQALHLGFTQKKQANDFIQELQDEIKRRAAEQQAATDAGH